jgi:hypothetical protein
MLLPIEVKGSDRLGSRDASSVTQFLREYGPEAPGALVLYAGERTFWIAARVLATLWWKVLWRQCVYSS